MLDKKALLEKIDNMPIDELQEVICSALDESDIPYEIGTGNGMSLSEFFGDGLFEPNCDE